MAYWKLYLIVLFRLHRKCLLQNPYHDRRCELWVSTMDRKCNIIIISKENVKNCERLVRLPSSYWIIYWTTVGELVNSLPYVDTLQTIILMSSTCKSYIDNRTRKSSLQVNQIWVLFVPHMTLFVLHASRYVWLLAHTECVLDFGRVFNTMIYLWCNGANLYLGNIRKSAVY